MKVIIWIVVPAIIIYVFWATRKLFNRSAPDTDSKEDITNHKNDYV